MFLKYVYLFHEDKFGTKYAVMSHCPLQESLPKKLHRLVSVSGKVLRLVDDTTLPQVDPTVVAAGRPVTVPRRSFGFVVIPDAKAPACLL